MTQLQEMPQVVNADFVHGGYDIVCVLEGECEEMDETVQVQKLAHVLRTTTLTVFDMAVH